MRPPDAGASRRLTQCGVALRARWQRRRLPRLPAGAPTRASRSAGRDRGRRAPSRSRPSSRAIRRARALRALDIPRRDRADLAAIRISAAFRRSASPPTARASSPSPTRAAGCAAASSIDGDAAGRHRGCRDGADARRRRQAARRARLVRHRVARRGRRHALCRHRARQPHRALRLSARTACWRAAQPIAVPPASATLPHNKGIECLVFVPQGPAARRHADRDLRARTRRGRQHPRLPDRRAEPRRASRSSAAAISTSAIARSLPGGDLLVLERSFSLDRAASACASAASRLARSSRARWSTARSLFEADSAIRSTTWKA